MAKASYPPITSHANIKLPTCTQHRSYSINLERNKCLIYTKKAMQEPRVERMSARKKIITGMYQWVAFNSVTSTVNHTVVAVGGKREAFYLRGRFGILTFNMPQVIYQQSKSHSSSHPLSFTFLMELLLLLQPQHAPLLAWFVNFLSFCAGTTSKSMKDTFYG